MADLTITAANVVAGSGAEVSHGISGATATAGQILYRDRSDNKLKLADSDSGTAGVRKPKGIALNGASNGQPMAYATKGPVTIGATLVPGTTYVLGDTPGALMPVGDLEAGDYPTIIGIALSTTVLDVNIQESGVAVPA